MFSVFDGLDEGSFRVSDEGSFGVSIRVWCFRAQSVHGHWS